MEWLQILILALLQGVTEFLPISSSAHLILVPVLTHWEDQGLAFDVALHLGSLTAVVLYFRRDITALFLGWLRSLQQRRNDAESRLAWGIIFATLPVGLAGFLLRDQVEALTRSPVLMAISLIGFGLLLGWADWRHRGQRTEYQINWKDVVAIGLAQALALIPGTSRSGITIMAALMMGMNREAAARFSFLLSIPVIMAACGLEIHTLLSAELPVDWTAMLAGIAISGVSAYLCIHYFLAFIKRIGMQPFVVYRVALGLLLLWIFL